MTIKATVKAGRFVIDEPTNLPDGTEVELLPLDPGDWLDDADRAALHKALRDSDADVAAGRLVDAEELSRELSIALTRRPRPIHEHRARTRQARERLVA